VGPRSTAAAIQVLGIGAPCFLFFIDLTDAFPDLLVSIDIACLTWPPQGGLTRPATNMFRAEDLAYSLDHQQADREAQV
jgi:hypothetical protein